MKNKITSEALLKTALLAFFVMIFNGCSSNSDDGPTAYTVANFIASIEENPTNGQVIGTISTSQSNGLLFSITNQSPDGAMSINSTSGELTVASAALFDFETNPAISGTVSVSNGNISQNSLITISLINIVQENIYNGNINLQNQIDVDNFGLLNYDTITGTLEIGIETFTSASNVVDLTPLSTLQSVNHLIINTAVNLLSLEGLHNLNSSVKSLRLWRNHRLRNIDALSNINSIEGLIIFECRSLVSIASLENAFAPTFTEIFIAENDELRNIDPLESFTAASTSDPGIKILYNSSLQNINGLRNIITPGERLSIVGNPSLLNIDGLESITQIQDSNFTSYLEIINNDLIENLDGLNQLTSFPGYLKITENGALQNLNGLTNLTTPVEFIDISGNSALTSLEGLAGIPGSPDLSIFITLNPSLINLSGLNNLTECFSINISNNDNLTNMSALNSLTDCNLISVNYNNNLTNLDGFESIDQYINSFAVTFNPLLSDFCGFNNYFINPSNAPENFYVYENLYNPTYSDLLNGDCSL